MTSPEKIDQFIKEAAYANFNTVFVQVRQRGDALYDSDFVSRSELLEGQDESFDPLAYAIKKGHEHGLEVHAWLNAMIASGSGTSSPKDPEHIFNKHPEWLMRDSTGKIAYPDPSTDPVNSVVEGPYFLSPGHPEVKDHLCDVYMEVIEKYDVDGIHFDFIRYPARMGPDTPGVGYNEVSVSRFREETGLEPEQYSKAWDQWRADQITDIVSRIYHGTKERRSEVEVSASVLAAWDLGLGRVFQDWRKWM
ncbi:glycoside hydrolase family 10 protein [Pseudalkalibacillus sp. A8]|uniref:glycoside hydrolase family 10 protein n=1 Tax=Pseudalkalibacillus sp. A8 TaxID=3382641 RepID=UPI0038B50831